MPRLTSISEHANMCDFTFQTPLHRKLMRQKSTYFTNFLGFLLNLFLHFTLQKQYVSPSYLILNLDAFSSRTMPHTGSLGITSLFTLHNYERTQVSCMPIMINGSRTIGVHV